MLCKLICIGVTEELNDPEYSNAYIQSTPYQPAAHNFTKLTTEIRVNLNLQMLKIFSNPICTKVGVHFTPIITRKQEKERRAHRVIRTYTARSVPGEMERETEKAREGWGVGWS